MLDLRPREFQSPDTRRDDARTLAAEGRFQEAVLLGQAVNRERRDTAFERELRDWRHRCASTTQAGSGRPDWPPRLPDPWPDLVDRIPEIQRAELTATLLGGALLHHGSLIVRGLLAPERAASYVKAIERAFGGRDAGGPDALHDPLEPSDGRNLGLERAFGGAHTILMADAPEFLALWMDEIEACGVLGAVSDYLGERPAISANKANLYRLPPDPGTQWHQDGAFLGHDIRTVNLWVAATECGIDAPGLEIIPWRIDHIVDTGTDGSKFGWSVGEGFADRLAQGRDIPSPHFRPGDAILFDQLCLHRTGVRPSMTRGRYAIETWMFAPSHYRDGVPLAI